MKKLNVYNVYIDDGTSTFKVIVPAETKKKALEYVEGNGEVVGIREDKDIVIDTDRLVRDLDSNGWGQEECNLLTRIIFLVGLDCER